MRPSPRRAPRSPSCYGVGPIVAAIVLGQVGDPRRFPTRDRFAAYNGTAPIEASSGPRVRHRLNQRGNRQLNHAMHLIAVTQIAHDTPGRAYFDRKLAEGKSKKEALRSLKRHISDAVWRQLQADLEPADQTGPGGQPGATLNQRGRPCTLTAGTSVKSLPDPTKRYAHPTGAASNPPQNRP